MSEVICSEFYFYSEEVMEIPHSLHLAPSPKYPEVGSIQEAHSPYQKMVSTTLQKAVIIILEVSMGQRLTFTKVEKRDT